MITHKTAKLTDLNRDLKIFLAFSYCKTAYNKIGIVRGSKNTIELIFTPNASPKNTDARINEKVLYCRLNFRIKNKDVSKKKVWIDSGVAKWACWISPGVIATSKAEIIEKDTGKKILAIL